MEEIGIGVGKIMKGVAFILALGAMLGRMLDASGAAEVIARTMIGAFGLVERMVPNSRITEGLAFMSSGLSLVPTEGKPGQFS